jgi:hypothetical protein
MAAQDLAEVDPEIHRLAEEVTLARFKYAGTTHPGMKELARLATMRRVHEMAEARNGN